MMRGLLFCATICSIATPVLADEREEATGAPRILPDLLVVNRNHSLARGPALVIASDFTVTIHSTAPAQVLLADFDDLIVPAPLVIQQATSDAPFAVNQLTTLKLWRVGDRLPTITSSANGLYAVRDVLGEFRKPRLYRQTAFSTMLVLKIDGKDDTAPFSVGGGGVAAALWKASKQ